MGIELSNASARFLQSVFPIFILLVFLASSVMIIAGILGRVTTNSKHKPKNKWSQLIKMGFVIFVVGIVIYIIMNITSSALGLRMSSFTGDTQVWTSNGQVRISDLDIGDEVNGFDIETNTIVTEKIEQCRSYKVNSYYLINGSLKVTPEHPFAVRQSDNIIWKKVKDLAIGDVLVPPQALRPLAVESIEEVSSDKPTTVYNPQVSGSNNYFVFVGNNNAALVHNKTTLPKLDPPQRCEQDDGN